MSFIFDYTPQQHSYRREILLNLHSTKERFYSCTGDRGDPSGSRNCVSHYNMIFPQISKEKASLTGLSSTQLIIDLINGMTSPIITIREYRDSACCRLDLANHLNPFSSSEPGRGAWAERAYGNGDCVNRLNLGTNVS
jgi:hypothetical protein